jgi:hypothetical protein
MITPLSKVAATLRRSLIGVGLALLLAQSAEAATRTIQFAGVATTYGDLTLPDSMPTYIACTVMIANTGQTNQVVNNMTMNVFDSFQSRQFRPTSSNTSVSTLTQEEIYNTGALPDSPSCSNASNNEICTCISSGNGATGGCSNRVINPGGVYIATSRTLQAAQAGFVVTPCSGSFTVQDVQPASPGSMVAAGAISFVGEQALTRGQFMGAIYMSGSHVDNDATTSRAFPAFGTQSLPSIFPTMQMNTYCIPGCELAGVDRNICSIMCGGGMGDLFSGARDTWLTGGHDFRNFSGYLEEFWGDPTLVPPIATNMHHDNRDRSSAEFSQFRSLNRYANPHYNGGHVVEMIMGPFESICSGNARFFNNGGDDFTHSDSNISSDAAFRIAHPTAAGRGPPERLYCSHGHDKDGPFGHVAQSTAFTIWGGNAF